MANGYKVFIDGKEGTTGLRIYERLEDAAGIELLTLSDEERKNPDSRKAMINQSDLVFLCLPDAAAKEAVSFIENSGVKVVDASTAHRTNPGWAYGFPELSESHRNAVATGNRVAVPGCHASGYIALVYPLVAAGLMKKDALLSCFSVTGYSGGGKSMIAEYEDKNRNRLLDAPRQYATAQNHKHLPEMAAVTGLAAPVFSPVVGDFYSGMTVSVPVFGKTVPATPGEITECYRRAYENNGVIRVLPYDGENEFLSGNLLAGSDAMEIKVEGNAERMVLTARFDNLGKGASGAAVQCMNLMLGRNETEGLNV